MLVIFDCDGVLVDSEKLAADIFSEVLQSAGITMSPLHCFQTFHGKTLAACYAWLEDKHQIQLPPDFGQKIQQETKKRFSLELQPVKGIFAVLDYLRDASIQFCVASNGGHEKTTNSLSATGMLQYFTHRFSAEDVKNGKPHPDLFLFAAHSMGETTRNTWVIEDSMSGYQAALAAGMTVLMYAQENHQQYPQARCFDSMTALGEFIKQQS